jgi:NAD(P)H-hydrate epimerase
VLGDADLVPAFVRRARDGHKGTFGHVYVLAGSPGRTGAARMACDAALRAGAGLVTLGTTREAFRMLGGVLYEAMSEVAIEPGEVAVSAAERLSHRLNLCQAVVIGPGLPVESEIGELLTHLLPRLDVPVVVDAEALNQLAWRKECFESNAPRVLTPHPGEAARLLGRTSAQVQADRVGAAVTLAEETNAVVVLKGAHTLVASPDGGVSVCPDGNPGMGSPGMGDVLAGLVGALMARGMGAVAGARAAVTWHARAGDLAAARRTETNLLARDVLDSLADVERKTC